MIRKLFRLFVALPAALVLVMLAVSNRHPVRLVLDPFAPQTPAVFVELPLYAYLFGAMVLGLVIGGFATWMSQSRWRKTARRRTAEARKWRREADRLQRQLKLATGDGGEAGAPDGNSAATALPQPGRAGRTVLSRAAA